MRSTILLLLFILSGLSLRFFFIFTLDRPLYSDERDYHVLATNLASKGLYGYDEKPSAFRPVGYPAFIAALYSVGVSAPVGVKVFQAILDTLTAILLFLILRPVSWRASPEAFGASIIAISLWISYPPAILYSNLLLSETLFTFLLVFGAFLIHTKQMPKWWMSVFVGFLFGILTLIKPWFLLFILFLFPFSKRLSLDKRGVALLMSGILLVTLPWMVRNYLQFGEWTLSLNGGVNLYIGNNPNATGGYSGKFSKELLSVANNEKEFNDRAFKEATRYISAEPKVFLINAVKKIAHIFSSQGELLVFTFSPEKDNSNIRYAKKYSTLPWSLILAVNIPYMIILMIGLLGWFLSKRDALWIFFTLFFFSTILIHATFFGGSRFLFPLMPFFTMFAATVLPELKWKLRSLSWKEASVIASIYISLIAIWIYEFAYIANI